MRGVVIGLQSRLDITFRLPERRAVTIEFVVDTGFAGALALPADAVAALDLPFEQEISAKLADDQVVTSNIHAATILWQEREVSVAVLVLGARPLLGTLLLEGTELSVQFTEGGSVSVAAL